MMSRQALIIHNHALHVVAINLHAVVGRAFHGHLVHVLMRLRWILRADCLRETAIMAKHSRAKRRGEHVSQTAHYKQQCETSWKKSLHLLNAPIITHPVQSANFR